MTTYNVQLEVNGMTCQHCVNTITSALKQIADIDPATVKVDLEKNQASFQWTGGSQEDIKKGVVTAIEDLGYDPGEIYINSISTSLKKYHAQFPVSGMTCSHCSNTIHKALCSLPFVDPSTVHVSLDTETATLVFNDPDLSIITKDKIKETVEDLGYDVGDIALNQEFEGQSSSPATAETLTTEPSTNYKIASFVLAGMTCQHCVKMVTDTLKSLPDVVADSVYVSLEKRQGRFLFEGDAITKETIKEIIEDLGYDVEGSPRIVMDTNDTHSILSKSFPTLNHLEINMSPGTTSKPNEKEKRKVVMRVLGMTCHSCVASVIDAIKTSIPGVQSDSVHVNLEAEMAMFICTNPQIDVIREAIEDRGFDIENVQFIHNLNPTAVVVGRRQSDHDLLTKRSSHRQNSIVSLSAISIKSSLAISAPHKVKLQINGMTCSSCVRTVERGLSNLPGVVPQSVQVNLLTHSGTFNMRGDKLDEKTIIKAVKNMGYTASNVVFLVESAPAKEHVGTNFKAEMIITGMFCGSCIEKVHGTLSKLHGIDRKSIEISLETGRTSFEFSGEYITRQRIHQAILQLGFAAESIKVTKLSAASDTASISSQHDKHLATTHLVVTGMTCSSCVANIERIMVKHEGVISCQVNLLARSAVIRHNPNIVGSRSLAQMIEQIGYKAELSQDNQGNDLSEQRASMREVMDKEIAELRSRFYWSLLFAIPVVIIAMVFMMALPSTNPIHRAFMKEITHGLSIGDLILFLLATPVQFWLGLPFYTKAYRSLVYSHTANMETLVAMGTTVAYVASVASVIAAMARPNAGAMSMNYFETSVLLITFIHFGKWLEALAKGKTAETITKLMDLQPETATLVEISKNPRNSLDGESTLANSNSNKNDVEEEENVFIEREIESKDIQVGDILKVNAGGRIPCDGKIWKGNSTADESMITGESVPVTKKEGDGVITATINLSSPIYIRAIRVGADTTLSRIIQLVNDAQASPKAPIERLADKISSIFVPIVILLAIITFVVWEVASVKNLYPDDWLPMGETKTIFSLMLAVSVLVIACPCGLGLASPTAVMVGTGVAAHYGVLVKGGGYALEMANRITTVAFDKTGTLTLGKPVVTNSWIDLPDSEADTEYAAQKIAIWKILGRVGSASNHPLSKSVEKKARFIISTLTKNPKATDTDLLQDNLEAEDFESENATGDMFEGVTITNAQEIAGRGLLATLTLSQSISEKLHGKLHNVRALNIFLGNQEWMNENYARYQNRRQAEECSELLGKWQNMGQSIVLVSASPVGGSENVESVGTHSEGCKNACACVVCSCSSTSVCCTASQTMMIAQIAIADIPRPEATQLIAELRKRKIEVWMITGDNQRTGEVIGEKLGIPKDFVLAGVKPEQKSDKIRNLQRRGIHGHSAHGFWRKNDNKTENAVVAMVGDGINDSPALAQADVGISVGSATDIAIEAASIVLIRNNLMDLLTMYDISKTVVRRIRLNFLWAFLYNTFAIPIAAGILYPACGQGLPPYVAGLAMVASSISVVCSSLLLRLYKAPKIVEESHKLQI